MLNRFIIRIVQEIAKDKDDLDEYQQHLLNSFLTINKWYGFDLHFVKRDYTKQLAFETKRHEANYMYGFKYFVL